MPDLEHKSSAAITWGCAGPFGKESMISWCWLIATLIFYFAGAVAVTAHCTPDNCSAASLTMAWYYFLHVWFVVTSHWCAAATSSAAACCWLIVIVSFNSLSPVTAHCNVVHAATTVPASVAIMLLLPFKEEYLNLLWDLLSPLKGTALSPVLLPTPLPFCDALYWYISFLLLLDCSCCHCSLDCCICYNAAAHHHCITSQHHWAVAVLLASFAA